MACTPCPSPQTPSSSPSPAVPTSPDASAAASADAGLFAVPHSYAPQRWWVLGPFPAELPSGATHRVGLEHDYLQSLGGEGQAAIGATTRLERAGAQLSPRPVDVNQIGVVDLAEVFGPETDFKLAYAYAEFEVAQAGSYEARFGSDDSARVWINGLPVHRVVLDRGVDPDSDVFGIPLVAGTNRVLVKVDNGSGGWGFALRILDQQGAQQLALRHHRLHLEALMPAPDDDDFLLGDRFPELHFQRHAASLVFDAEPPRVRWFGPDLRELVRPDQPGRYAALVEARTRDGDLHRRLLAFAKADPALPPSLDRPPFGEPSQVLPLAVNLPLNDQQRWELSRQVLVGGAEAISRGQLGAQTAARLQELRDEPARGVEPVWLGGSYLSSAEYQLALRMRLEKRVARPLAPPAALSEPAGELRRGSEREAGMRPGSVARIRKVARQWANEDPNGFVVLIARRGVIFMHEGFNGFLPETTFWPASIGKSLAGLLFGRAVDQGLLKLDQPVGDVLPDFRSERLREVTFRNLFNHVSGLSGHLSHGGMFNAYLDNALALQDARFGEPRQRYRYNGDDLNLAGKALELVCGTSALRLLHEHLQRPFDAPVTQFDLGVGHRFTARYLAQVGQMILQDGAYGQHRFFSSGFLEQLWPRPIRDSVPGFGEDREWGIGFEWTVDPDGPREAAALGPRVVGHAAASGSLWRIALDQQLVIVVGRSAYAGGWGDNEKRLDRFVVAVAENLG